MSRRGAVALAAFSCASVAARARDELPASRAWALSSREPQWRARFEGRDGAVVGSVSVLHRNAAGVVVVVFENREAVRTAFIERRDGAGAVVWRHSVPGLPERYDGINVLPVQGTPPSDLIVVASFNPVNRQPREAVVRIIDVDIERGALRVLGGFPYPDDGPRGPDNYLELTGARLLPSGLFAVHGGVGLGPFHWWIGLRKPDGAVVWDVVSRRGLGHIVDLRPDGAGLDVSLVNVMSHDLERGIGSFRVRIDAAGRIAGSVKLWQRESAPRFTPDGGMAYVDHRDRQPVMLEAFDRQGRLRLRQRLPDAVLGIERVLDDGTFVLGVDNGFIIVAPDGRSAIAVATHDETLAVLPDGALAVSRCEGERCGALTVSIFDRPS